MRLLICLAMVFSLASKVLAQQRFDTNIKPPGSLLGDIELNHYKGLDYESKSGVNLNPDVGAYFYSSYYLGLEFEVQTALNMAYNDKKAGFNDLRLYVGDRNLFSSEANQLFLRYQLNGIFPTSIKSRDTSLNGGVSAKFTVIKKTSIGNFSIENEFLHYIYEWDTEKPGSKDFNTPFGMKNEIGMTFKIFKALRWRNEFQLQSVQYFTGNTENAYRITSGLEYFFNKALSANLTYRYKSKSLMPDELEDYSNYTVFTGLTYNL